MQSEDQAPSLLGDGAFIFSTLEHPPLAVVERVYQLLEAYVGIVDFEKSFAYFASRVSKWTGSSMAFSIAALFILVWAITGPFFGFSPSWQMVVNTVTTIATFLMVFVIQNSQNRDGLALQIKLDEIIRAIGKAENSLIDLEDRSQEELDQIKDQFAGIAVKARNGKSRPRTVTVGVVEKSLKTIGTKGRTTN
jgi:low affinity Fe/Cu permease